MCSKCAILQVTELLHAAAHYAKYGTLTNNYQGDTLLRHSSNRRHVRNAHAPGRPPRLSQFATFVQ